MTTTPEDKHPGGRPSKLEPERANRLIGMIRAGAYASVAARAAGIGESTFHRWMARGRDAAVDDDGAPIDPDDAPFRELWESVKGAEAEAEVAAIGRITKAAQEGTWQASAWYLERKFSDRWGRKDHLRQEVTGEGGGPVHVDAKAELLAVLAARRPEGADPLTGEPTDPTSTESEVSSDGSGTDG